ncbi:MAG: STAS domain-containing protein [Desulfuromonadaceae bacterium]|nr:STAS domain-containing protein [Desulfuromonadaceae bacterium]MDD5107658.1 STAS domain-containing protein [Desulfuromonadaceae bacterium]
MNIKMEQNEGVVVLFVREDRLDANNSEELKRELHRHFDSGKKNLIIDLAEIHFIDSSGLGALVSAYKNASLMHGTLKLSGLQSQVKSMFELTRLYRVFDIFSTVDDALLSYK